MATDDFEATSRTEWDAAVDQLLPAGATCAEWWGATPIAAALQPILGPNSNHAFLPTRGGVSVAAATVASGEVGCLELRPKGGSTYLVKPRKLTAERVVGAPGNSFLLLELDQLPLTDVYEDDPDEVEEDGLGIRGRILERGQEEVVEISPGHYVDRSVWDHGSLGYDEDGREVPIPQGARLVVRFLRGKVLFAAKASLWNRDPTTYDGRHSNMTPDEVREAIERSIARGAG